MHAGEVAIVGGCYTCRVAVVYVHVIAAAVVGIVILGVSVGVFCNIVFVVFVVDAVA